MTGQIDIADRLASAEIETARPGLNLAFLLTLAASVASIVFLARGRRNAGASLLSVPAVMLIRSFLQWPGGQDPPDGASDRASDG